MEKYNNKLKWILIILGYCLLVTVIILLAAGQKRTAAEELSPSAETTEETSETTAETTETTAETTETTAETEPEVKDTTPPVITGVEDLTVHAGTTVSYKANVAVTDDTDTAPSLTVDASHVNTDTVGTYYVIYIAEDAAGNRSYEVANIHVVPLEVISSDEANALADEILGEILYDGMSEYEMIQEVFFYLHAIGYTDRNYGDIGSYLDNAYYFLTTRMGDCRCFYAASRLLLERLGYQTIMVKSTESSTRLHYWNLVSTDGGNTWYHFDPTDWEWDDNGEFICMVTDSWLRDYAYEHDYPALNWDAEFYPATPEYDY